MRTYKKKSTEECWRMLNGRPSLVSTRLDEQKRKSIYNPYKRKYEVKMKMPIPEESVYQLFKLKRNLTSDDIWVGDSMQYDNLKNNLRIWVQNWNGLEKTDMNKFQYDLYEMKRRDIQYFSIIESTVNTTNKHVTQKLEESFDRIYPDANTP